MNPPANSLQPSATVRREMHGPPTFDAWELCGAVRARRGSDRIATEEMIQVGGGKLDETLPLLRTLRCPGIPPDFFRQKFRLFLSNAMILFAASFTVCILKL